jgi:hypothetical protein
MDMGELRKLRIAEFRNEVSIGEVGIALQRPGGDLFLRLHCRKSSLKSLPHRRSRQVDVFGRIRCAQQPRKFFLCVLSCASNSGRGDTWLARRWIRSRAVPQGPCRPG